MAKFDVDGDLVRKLAGLLEETGLGEIEFESADCRIKVVRPGGPAVAAAPMVAAPSLEAVAAVAAPVSGDPGSVTSPMVGTIYLSPSPDEPPFVTVGDSVIAGQTLMLVEAMKTFNEISAPKAGKVTEILVESGQPVEFGEVLAKVG
ncbi:MAG: acetyl-CoA carboxylase biotin carboxyl carrier protein [Alphaproteobacteria bacterium]